MADMSVTDAVEKELRRLDDEWVKCAKENTALREQLREAREGLIQTHEEDQEYTVTFTQELREELAEVREQLRKADEIKAELQRLLKEGAVTVRRLTAALRDAAHDATRREAGAG